MSNTTCPRCGGTGTVASPSAMRKLREDAGVTLRQLAKQMNVSAPYLSDLELGHRQWTESKAELFRWALDRVTNGNAAMSKDVLRASARKAALARHRKRRKTDSK